MKKIYSITNKIIDVLSKIEDEIKSKWEQKKDVKKEHYIITIDKLHQWLNEKDFNDIIDDVLKNKKQAEEWKQLGFGEIKTKDDIYLTQLNQDKKTKKKKKEQNGNLFEENDTTNQEQNAGKNNPIKKLPIDTRHFDETFQENLLEKISEKIDIEEELNGLLIKSENWQALNNLLDKYREKIKCIYIDPPYNTGNDGFLYKDGYQHSTWLTMMENRLQLARELMSDDGVIFVSIDDNEQAHLKALCDENFGRENFINVISVKTGESLRAIGGGESKKLKKKAEFITFYAKNKRSFIPNPVYELTPLWEIIESKKQDGKNFEYNQVLISEGTKAPFDKFVDGYGNEITIFKHNDYRIESLNDFMKENKIENHMDVYDKFSDKIFELVLSEYSILKKVQEKTDREFYSIEYIPSSGKWKGNLTRRFFYKQRELIFLSGTIEKINNTLYRKEKLSTLWVDISWQGIMNEGGISLKYGKKAVKLLQRIIELSTNKNDLILDFFAGSGTTAHAVMKLNAEDDGKRKFILVEMAE